MAHENSISSDTPPRAGLRDTQRAPKAAWFAVCLLLLGVSWLPLFAVHLHNMSRNDAAAGPVIAVFAPTLASHQVFRRVSEAGGSMVEPIRGWRHAWIVQSLESGFAGRLRAQGAWGVFSPDLLSPRAFLDCFRVSSSPGVDARATSD